MSDQFEMHITQKIQVKRKDLDGWFSSSIQDVSYNVISIALPYLKDFPLVLHRGDEVQVRLAAENATYSFNTRVIGQTTDNIKLYRLIFPKEVLRIQQRLHVRLPVMLDVQYFVQTDDKKPHKFIGASIVDLSGGGMKLAVRENIKERSRLSLEFKLPLHPKPLLMKQDGLVVRSQPVDPEKGVYHLGVDFIDISRQHQDMIVRYIFERMAQQKRLR
ncbi:flagellar brake protein [Desulfoscipio sp. XC116]|uniref:flagellar brake protein n=1 Tax=Desulfoscipio sp. XC116 TaxID=3144975 RepID=UPI00325B4A38